MSPAADARFSPGATVTFDWNDVAGAATYTLQIDNSSTFAAPYTLEVSVTASQHAAAGLPTQRMWWRVRAVDANGTPGSWTSGRRFEIKN